MPAYIVIVASLVTVVQFLMQAYLPSLSAALGVYIPLIVVNCIILGRAESYASKNPPVESIFDGNGNGTWIYHGPYNYRNISGLKILMLKNVPAPKISRISPIIVRPMVNPSPIPIPSKIDSTGGFFEA